MPVNSKHVRVNIISSKPREDIGYLHHFFVWYLNKEKPNSKEKKKRQPFRAQASSDGFVLENQQRKYISFFFFHKTTKKITKKERKNEEHKGKKMQAASVNSFSLFDVVIGSFSFG